MLALALCSPPLVTGYGAKSTQAPTIAPEARQDEIIRYRAVRTDLRKHPLSREATVDLERVEAWLQTVQGLLAREPEAPRTRLYLDAIRAELVNVQSHYARRAATGEAMRDGGEGSQLLKEDAP